MRKKSPFPAALAITLLMALFLLSACESKPKTEAERTVEFLRDLTDEKVAKEFHPAYWEGQCRANTQIWKTGLKICGDRGPHHWMCDVITTMQDCQARSVGVH